MQVRLGGGGRGGDRDACIRLCQAAQEEEKGSGRICIWTRNRRTSDMDL